MRIRVCIPFYSDFELVKPFLRELKKCKEHEFVMEPRQGGIVSELMNSFINDNLCFDKKQSAIKGFDYFLNIDSDIEFTVDQVLRMIDYDKDIVVLPYKTHRNENLYQCGRLVYNIFGRVLGGLNYGVNETGFKKIGWSGNGMKLTKDHIY